MQDVMSRLTTLRRPRMLIRAARHGAMSYRRETHLQRVLGYGRVPRSDEALDQLMQLEADHEDLRANGFAGYSAARHLDVLIAVVAESELMTALRSSPVT